MPLFEAVRLALTQLRVHKLKSTLTIVGVTIGITFLIAIVSVVQGVGRYMQSNVVGKFMTVNGFEIHQWPILDISSADEQTRAAYHRRPPLYERDTIPILAALPTGFLHAFENSTTLPVASEYTKPRSMLVSSVTPEYFTIKNLQMTEGRPFTTQEDAAHTPVVVIGHDVKEHCFPSVDPIGRTLRIDGIPYQVIGVAEPQGSVLGLSFDRFVIVPYDAPAGRLTAAAPGQLSGMLVQGPNPTAQIAGEEATREVLRAIHGLHPGQPDDFAIETSNAALSLWDNVQRYLIIAGVILPAIGLIVGAIVIMNIMLMAVVERTREIGIRKSLGARRRDILWQFLIESATLSTVGALVGIGAGLTLAWLLTVFTPLPASVAPWSIVTAIALGLSVGIAAGVYPASRAARLDPIIALHVE